MTAAPSETLRSLSKKMDDSGVGAIPIVEGDRLQGIVTDRDIVVRCLSRNKDPGKMTARETLSTQVPCTTRERPVTEGAPLMGAAQVRRLPVLRGSRVAGMVSLGDIAKVKTDSEVARAVYNIAQPPAAAYPAGEAAP